jgi:hypothetical protein
MEKAFNTFLKLILIGVLSHLILTMTLGNVLTKEDDVHVFSGVVKKANWTGGKSSMGTVFLEESGNSPNYLTTYNRDLVVYLESKVGTEYQFEYFISYTYSIFEPQKIIKNVKSMEGNEK